MKQGGLPTFLHLSVFLLLWLAKQGQSFRTITIAGVFPCEAAPNDGESFSDGAAARAAVEIAIEEVNRRNILPDYQLELIHNNTQCVAGRATRDLFHLIHEPPIKFMILDGACYDVTERIAEAASTWNLVTVSYSSTASSLSDRSTYPLFLRTISPDTSLNDARIALMSKFNWRRVGLIKKNEVLYSMALNHLQSELQNTDIEVVTSETFTEDPTASVENLKEKDVRIIIGNFDERSARKVFCRAYHSGLFGSRYVWLIVGWYSKHWWAQNLKEEKIGCTEEQMSAAVRGYIACDNARLISRDATTGFATKFSEIARRYYEKTNRSLEDSDAGYAYDAVWAVALALNRTQGILETGTPPSSIGTFHYMDGSITRLFYSSMLDTEFPGISGPVKFTSQGDRIGNIWIEQLQDGEEKLVSLYFGQNGTIESVEGTDFVWQGGTPPMDHAKIVTELVTPSSVIYGVMCVLASLCLILAIGFLVANIKLRHYRYIQMSSPRLNNAIIVGCIMMYSVVFLLGVDGNSVSSRGFSVICQLKTWITSLAFTVAFGAMFVKTWRVYVIFTNTKLRKKVIRDEKLFPVIGILLLVDIFILSLWTALDPLHRELTNGTIQHRDAVDILPQVEHCSSAHKTIWLGVLLAYKALLLLFGALLAWETRTVKVAALNDSRLIGMSVYNVVILTVIGVPVSMVLEDSQNAALAFEALLVIFCTTATLILVFVPKFLAIKRNPSVLNTSGGTSISVSETGTPGDSSAVSQDRGMTGPKAISLAAENSALKALIAEKEKQITELESKLKSFGVTPERIRRISRTAIKPDTLSQFSPDRTSGNQAGSIHVEISSAAKERPERSPFEKEQAQVPARESCSRSFLSHEPTRQSLSKKYSLPPRIRTELPPIEVRGRVRSHSAEMKPSHCESYERTEADVNENRSPHRTPTIKGLQRKGSVVLVTRSRTGETCFQVKTPVSRQDVRGEQNRI